MAASVRYQRIRLTLNSPWNQDGKTSEDWSVMFSLSGATDLLPNEQEPTALDLFDPMKQLCTTNTYLKHWSFYPIQGHAASGFKDYLPSDHPCTHSAFATTTELQQLEVCALAECPVGKSATGKPKYLRKWIHNLKSDGTGNAISPFNTGVTIATILAKWNTGCGPRSLVPVSPTDGTQGGPWTLRTQLHVHQLRKGVKRKAAVKTVYVPVPVP
jgi:hypothetical protein